MKKLWLLLLGLLGFLVIAGSLSFFFSKVGMSIMSGQAEWGQFGDYLGGTTNPILAFLTFVGVLWTISLTHDDLQKTIEMNKQQKVSEQKETTYRIVERIYLELKEILSKQVDNHNPKEGIPVPVTVTLQVAISDSISRSGIWERVKEDNYSDLLIVHDLLTQLKFYLTKYDSLAGDDLLSAYYKRYFVVVAMHLKHFKIIPEDLYEYYKRFTVYS
jgi:hypothetical protein